MLYRYEFYWQVSWMTVNHDIRRYYRVIVARDDWPPCVHYQLRFERHQAVLCRQDL